MAQAGEDEATRLIVEHAARWRRAVQGAVLTASTAPLLWLLLAGHVAHYALSVTLPALPRANGAALAALVCLAGVVVLQAALALRPTAHGAHAALAQGALLAAGLATAVAVDGTPAALALVALFIGGAVVITASPLRPVLALAPWALASVLLWRAGDSGALLTLQLLAGLAVALGALLARQRDATLARRHVRFWRQRLAQRRQRALAQGRARYIAAASHDLRQPLHAMSFLARMFHQVAPVHAPSRSVSGSADALLLGATLVGRGYAGLRGVGAAILRSSARRCLRASAAPLRGAPRLAGRGRSAGATHASRNPGFALSRNLARADIRANPASLMKYPG